MAHSPTQTGSSNGWTGYKVFWMASMNSQTAYSPFERVDINGWTDFRSTVNGSWRTMVSCYHSEGIDILIWSNLGYVKNCSDVLTKQESG